MPVVRLVLLAVILAVSMAAGNLGSDRAAEAVLTGIAILASLTEKWPFGRPWVWFAEAAAAGVVIGLASSGPDATGVYLLAPVIAATLFASRNLGTGTWALGCAVTTGVALAADTFHPSLLLWCALAALGLSSAWVARQFLPADDYRSAHRLLRRLQKVARQLPSGLDEVALAQQALELVDRAVPSDRSVLLLRQDDSWRPYAVRGTDRNPVQSVTSSGWLQEVRGGKILTGWAVVSGQDCQEAVLPLIVGDELVGIIVLQSDAVAFDREELAHLRPLAAEAALRIDSGLLFAEVRSTATVEERRRLAREIHDGIAQELASVGYALDALVADLDGGGSQELAEEIRSEIRRIVSEVRLSIFDLRAEIQPGVGLAPALTAYVQQAGTAAGLTVHLIIEEGTQRLTLPQETELLRIAQEAVTNVRRHASAQNLWVTCRIDPPYAFLRVADDGGGMDSPREDSYGLDIMQERASRIGATVGWRTRDGGGTVLEAVLEPPAVEREETA